ncbi:MAG: hypothetical protein Q4E01_07900 [Actinomycetaceae bacterium]|nr:hypothetical protein [Actinomycetaceae bacterium]
MGSRLGVFVRTDEGWQLYYDHWGAQSIGGDIALDGYAATMERIRYMRPLDSSRPIDLEAVNYLEGTLVIDETSKTVFWNEESQGLYLPRIINFLVEHSWPGWTAVWNAEDHYSALQAMQVRPDLSKQDLDSSHLTIETAPWIGPWDEFEPEDAMAVTYHDGTTLLWHSEVFQGEVLAFSPEELYRLALKVRRQIEEGKQWAWKDTKRDELPETGIHFDFTENSIRWWSLYDNFLGVEAFNTNWQGWTYETVGDNYEWLEQVTGETLRAWVADVAQCRYYLRELVNGRFFNNRGLKLKEALLEWGHRIDEGTGSFVFDPMRERAHALNALHLLDELDTRGPIPPARYIDRHGNIVPPIRQ